MSRALVEYGMNNDISQGSQIFVAVLRGMDHNDPRRIMILECYSAGFRAVFITMAAVSVSALVVSLVMEDRSMTDSQSQDV